MAQSHTKHGFFFLLLFFVLSCQKVKKSEVLFALRSSSDTGLDFSNDLGIDLELNILNYLYYYNGGGLAAGDFNNDGLTDLFFTSNLGEDRMYLNTGELTFRDVSDLTNVDAGQGGWTTGASIVDINADGLLDIYICQVGDYLHLDARNKLLVCTGIQDGIPHYEERAEDFGLDFKGLSTNAGFFDYDLDGDLDMYLLNQSTHDNRTFGMRADFDSTFNEVSGDRLFRNDEGYFQDVSIEAGIQSTAIGYGLGLGISDVNWDGYPDIFVGNDFHENDYLYINQGDGTFKESLTEQMMHCSKYSMGCDIADINNDRYPDILSLDMLPEDPEILKRSVAEENISVFNFKLLYGYHEQYAMNNLQLNNGNGTFSEIARYAGLEATDWSWGALIADWNMDGHKDVFISNGIPRRPNDIDYVDYHSSTPLSFKVKASVLEEGDLGIIERMPEIKIKNKLFVNDSSLRFRDYTHLVKNNKRSYSSGLVYADFDNDGDYDIVCNNINETPFLYENLVNPEQSASIHTVDVKLQGSKENPLGIGAKVLAFESGKVQYQECFMTKGFQSSMTIAPIFAIENADRGLDSLTIIWPDGRSETMYNVVEQRVFFEYADSLPFYKRSSVPKLDAIKVIDVASELNLDFAHQENRFIEFHREPLITHGSGAEGPALAIGDLNGDGLEDLFLGSSKGKVPFLFFQEANGKFKLQTEEIFTIDPKYEQVDAFIADLNGDGMNDLLLAHGGNEYALAEKYTRPLLYLGTDDGELILSEESGLSDVHVNASSIAATDMDGDGDVDLFFGGRTVPYMYGTIPRSFLLENNGEGYFEDVTEDYSDILDSIGMVSDACWSDADGDGNQDLVVAVEWGGIYIFKGGNDVGLRHETPTQEKGLWTFVRALDYDGDNDIDLIIGNKGLNSRLRASVDYPVRMYYADFDENDSKEQVVTHFVQDKEVTFLSKKEIESQLSYIKDEFQYASEFSEASIQDIIGKDGIQAAEVFEVNHMENSLSINKGDTYELVALPDELQWTSYRDAFAFDFDKNGEKDILLVGNDFDVHVAGGRQDADFGKIFMNPGSENSAVAQISDPLKGQARKISPIVVQDKTYFVIAMNNGKIRVLDFY